MPSVHLSARGVPEPIRAGLDALHERLEVPAGFPADVMAEAAAALRVVAASSHLASQP